MLNEMRLGKLSNETIDSFKKLSRPVIYADGIEPTELFPTRYEVERANNARMNNLGGEVMQYPATDTGSVTDRDQRTKMLSNCMAPMMLNLKKGSQVMLIKNMDESLVNGSIGVVEDFVTETYYETAQASRRNGDDEAEESDGGSTTTIRSKPVTAGMNLGLSLRRFPLVRFTNQDGTSRELLAKPESWKIELPNGEVQACRSQVPLILAWALSIHKAQGQTLERVKVNLGKVFEKGQAYVALSRATSQEGLQVLNFAANKVMAHDRVAWFYGSLTSIGPKRKIMDFTGKAARKENVDMKSRLGVQQPSVYGAFDVDDDEQEAMYG
jgi:ATP-dependent DNA helicase PIF1